MPGDSLFSARGQTLLAAGLTPRINRFNKGEIMEIRTEFKTEFQELQRWIFEIIEFEPKIKVIITRFYSEKMKGMKIEEVKLWRRDKDPEYEKPLISLIVKGIVKKKILEKIEFCDEK